MVFTLLVPPTESDVSQFTLTVKTWNQSGVIVGYESLPGNLPNFYGNSVALWNSTVPNPTLPPLAEAPVPTNEEGGEIHIEYDKLQGTNYSITYQTGPVSTRCAMALLKLATAARPPLSVTISLEDVDDKGARVGYNTLVGYLPMTYKNWIGLWQGFASPYTAPPPDAQVAIAKDSTKGDIVVPYAFGAKKQDYTLIYFTGPENKNAATFIYFEAGAAHSDPPPAGAGPG